MTKNLAIDVSIVVKNAAAIRQSVLDAFEDSDAVTLDIVEGQAVDLCGIQLIESARRHAHLVGKTLSLAHPGTDFRAVLEAAGFLTEASADDLQFWLHQGPAQ